MSPGNACHRSRTMCALLIFVGLFAACPGRTQPASTSQRRGSLVAETLTYDFGTATPGEILEHEFTFTNRGPEPITIHSVRSSCGCTQGHVSQHRAAPGEKVTLHTRFDTAGRRGPQKKMVYLFTSDPVVPTITCTLSGTLADARADGPASVYFQNVRFGQEAAQSIVLDMGEAPPAVREILLENSFLKASPIADAGSQKDSELRVEITCAPTAPIGTFSDRLRIFIEGEDRPHWDIPVAGRVVGDFLWTPLRLDVGKIDSRRPPVTHTVYIHAAAGTTAAVTAADTRDGKISVTLSPIGNGRHYRLDVSPVGKGAPGQSVKDVICIATDSKLEPLIEISFIGIWQ